MLAHISRPAILALVMLLLLGATGYCAPPVWWMAELGPEGTVSVTIRSRVRIKEVHCKVKFLDERNREVGTLSVPFTGDDLPELAPEEKYMKNFRYEYKEAKSAEGVLLFAVPAVSSPKAIAGTNVGQLEKGVPPYGQGP